MKTFPVTFRKVTAGHYRNDETGVEIVKVDRQRLGRNGHRVAGWSITAPSHSPGGTFGRSEVGFATTLKAAKDGDATRIALDTRAQIAADHAAATAEYIDRASRPNDASDRGYGKPSHISPSAHDYTATARTYWRHGEFGPARTWARLAEEAVAEAVADQYDEALSLMAQPTGSEPRGDECRAPIGSLSCARPNGHRDAVGHAPVRYPEGTAEYAAYWAALTNELDKFAKGEMAVVAEPVAGVPEVSVTNLNRRRYVACDNGGEVPPSTAPRRIGCAPALLIGVIDEACPLLTRHAHDERTGAVIDGVQPDPGCFAATGFVRRDEPFVDPAEAAVDAALTRWGIA